MGKLVTSQGHVVQKYISRSLAYVCACAYACAYAYLPLACVCARAPTNAIKRMVAGADIDRR